MSLLQILAITCKARLMGLKSLSLKPNIHIKKIEPPNNARTRKKTKLKEVCKTL